MIVTEDPAVFAKTARQWDPSVIMLDLNIPDTDGIQLLRALAADKCAAHAVLASGADGRLGGGLIQRIEVSEETRSIVVRLGLGAVGGIFAAWLCLGSDRLE